MALRFIETNPAVEQFDRSMRSSQERARNDFSLDDQMRRSNEQQGVDAATRAGVRNYLDRQLPQPQAAPQPQAQPQPAAQPQVPVMQGVEPPTQGEPPRPAAAAPQPAAMPQQAAPAAPVQTPKQASQADALRELSSTLARTPGGGARALETLQGSFQADRQREETERAVITALARGDRPTADFLIQRHGIAIPPDILNEMGRNGLFARGMLLSEKLYREDPQQAQAFARAYAQSGNLETAFKAAGVPRSKPNLTFQQVVEADKVVTYLVDRNRYDPAKPFSSYATQVGSGPRAGMGGAAGTGGAAGPRNQYEMANMLAAERARAEGRALTQEDILAATRDIAAARANPQGAQGVIVQWARHLAETNREFRAMTPEQQLAEARRQIVGDGAGPAAAGPDERGIPQAPGLAPRGVAPPAAPGASSAPPLRSIEPPGAAATPAMPMPTLQLPQPSFLDPNDTGAGAGVTTFDETEFTEGIRGTDWFREYVEQFGEEPDLRPPSNDPSMGPNYDYRAAWAAGLRPDVRDQTDQNRLHWPSQDPSGRMLKTPNHPTYGAGQAPSAVTRPGAPYVAPRPTDAPIRGSMVYDPSTNTLVPAR